MIKIESAMMRHIGDITSIEIWAQDYPMDSTKLREFVDEADKFIIIAKIGTKFVGFAACHKAPEGLVIDRLSVNPNFQNMGVGCKLVSSLVSHALKKKMRCVSITVPSYKMDDPGDSDYIGGWINKNNFKISNCHDRLYFRYGKWYDGYLFGVMV